MNSDSTSGRARLPWIWRYALILFSLSAVVVLFYAEENWRGRHAWAQYRQELIKRGEPADPSSAIPPQVRDDQNFAMTPFLASLFNFVPGTQRWRDTNGFARAQNFTAAFDAASSAVKSPKISRSNSWVRPQLDLDAWNAALRKKEKQGKEPDAQAVSNRSNPAEAAADVLAALAQYDPVLEELRAASQRPSSRFNLFYEYDNPAAVVLPHLSVLKRTSQVLQLRASAELAANRTDQALEDIKLILNLADSIRNEPILISFLVRISQFQIALQPISEGITRGQWSDAQLAVLQERLSNLNFLADAHRALEGERVLFGAGVIDYVRRASNKYDTLQNLGLASGQAAEGFNPPAAAIALMPSGWFYLEKRNYHRLFVEHMLPMFDLQAGRISPGTVQKFQKHLDSVLGRRCLKVVFRHNYFITVLMPALAQTAQKTAQAQTAENEAIVACALERFRLARGSYPETTDALVPQFIAKLPVDVITGEALKYHRTDDGHYVLYSVGWNEQDDGGVVAQAQNGGALDYKNGDWVWR